MECSVLSVVRQLSKGGRWGLAAKQVPHRPSQAPALGLRAGNKAL
jgi:hypothetical protein